MPDNVSLTASDINTLKNAQNSANSRLNLKNFFFKQNGSSTSKQMSLIGDNSSGIKIYAERKDAVLKSTGATVKFTWSKMNMQTVPIVQVTISSDNDISSKRISCLVNDVSNSGCTVYVDGTSVNDNYSIVVNLLAIGYA